MASHQQDILIDSRGTQIRKFFLRGYIFIRLRNDGLRAKKVAADETSAFLLL